MLNGKSAASIAFVVSVVVSISISALAVSKMLVSPMAVHPFVVSQNPAFPSNEEALEKGPAAQDELTREGQSSTSSPPSGNHDENPTSEGIHDGEAGYLALDRQSPSSQKSDDFASLFYSPLYESSPYILPITWGAVAGTLIWRGKVRSQWCKQGYDYDTFRLLARMKGSPIRVALLTSVSSAARTRAQMAADLDVDWKTIDNHIDVLAKNGLVQEIGTFGTCRYYAITERGRRVLSLLLSLDGEGSDINASSCDDTPKVAVN